MNERTHCRHGHEYTPENTYWPKSGRQTCRTCQVRWQREHRERRAVELVPALLERCASCGGEQPVNRMHWHHRDKTAKLFDVSKGHHYTKEAVAAEIAKCDRICTSCHSRYHRALARWRAERSA